MLRFPISESVFLHTSQHIFHKKHRILFCCDILIDKGILPEQNRKKKMVWKRVLVVDDIYTTGSTIDAVSKVLKKSGVEEVYFLTIAIGNGQN